MLYDTLIFDLDGTLLNTLPDLHAAVNYSLRAFSMPERTMEEVRCFVGNGIYNLIKRSVPDSSDKETVDAVLDVFKKYYKENSCNLTAAYDGIHELLSKVKSEGLKLAVVTNKAHFAALTICDTYFPKTFDLVLGERESEGIKKKPAPDAVYDVMKRLSSKSALYIGDSEVDIETARNASLPCAVVTWGFRTREELKEAEMLFDTAEELLRHITE